MKHATRTFQVVSLNFHCCSMPTRKALKTNNRNNAPCIGPIDFTIEGLSKLYFNGTAIKTKTSNEMPSKNAKSRKRPIVVVKYFFIIKMF